MREKRLVDADDPGDDRNRDHAGNEQAQEPHVVFRDRDVEDLAEQERRDHADRRGEEDQREDDAEARSIRPEQHDDPAQVRLADRGIRRPLHGLVGEKGIEASPGTS
jgi:hypothetical protein